MFMLPFGMAASQENRGFHARDNLVPVPAIVRDERGNVIYGLSASDFIIEDNGAAQSVHLDEAAEAEPISLVIAVQCGRRARGEFPRISGMASMLDPVLSEPRNETALLLF